VGRGLLALRLAARDVRRRPIEAALLLVAIMASTTTLTLGLVLDGVARDPYQATRDAAAGPDVVAAVTPDFFEGRAADPAGLETLARAPGVTGHAGPYPVTGAVLEARGELATAQVEGRDAGAAEVDRPELTEGRWLDAGGAVVEAAFADALGLGAGDSITLNDRPFRVVGVAVSAAAPPYPDMSPGGTAENRLQYCPLPSPSPCDTWPAGGPGPELDAALRRVDIEHPGRVWLTQADARSLAREPASLNYVVHLRLADPAGAQAFVDRHLPAGGSPDAVVPATADAPAMRSWQQIRDEVADVLERNEQAALLVGSRLLGLLAVASIAVLVGGRMSDQTRRVGLLKAVGGTPGMVAAVLLAEYVLVALLAAAAGLAAGWLAAPLLADPGVGLLGGAGAPTLTASTVGTVAAAAVGVAVAATAVPALRAARTSTVGALADAPRAPRRSARLIALSARLPVPLLLGLRVAGRRPRRVALAVVSVAITVSGIVAALATEAQAGEDRGSAIAGDRLDRALLVITVTLVALAAVNAVFITWSSTLDARHSSAVARALGATPHQVSTGLSAAQVVPALAGAALGIPGGIALVSAVDDAAVLPPLWQLLAVLPATALVVAGLATIPARRGARRSAAETLQAEHA
jgi:ABC-type lipoprotein release transport system permease subunit